MWAYRGSATGRMPQVMLRCVTFTGIVAFTLAVVVTVGVARVKNQVDGYRPDTLPK